MEEALEENHQLVPATPEEDANNKPTKRRKLNSPVWKYFTVKPVSLECKRAFCNHCSKSYSYVNGTKTSGTSHLKRHLEKGQCGAVPYINGGGEDHDHQSTLTPKIRNTANPGAARRTVSRKPRWSHDFDYLADKSRRDIARMIIMHDYPLDMVEHPGFLAFVQSLQPQFASALSLSSIERECIALYSAEKQKLMQFFQEGGMPGRISLSLDLQMSRNNLGYVFVTAHFTDSSWKTQKWLLNVVLEPYPDSDTALSHAVAYCLSEWRLESKLLSITLNHYNSLSQSGISNLKSHLSVKKNPEILNGQLVLGKCISHTFTAMANDVLFAGRDVVKKIRDNIKYVTTCESYEEKFFELRRHLQVPSEVGLFLDDQSRWNTTCQMLIAASELKEVFSCLDTVVPEYNSAPSMEDWKHIEIVCSYLKSLFDATEMLTASSTPAVVLFQEALRIQTQIACGAASGDPFTGGFIRSIQERLDLYWRECGLAMAISTVMDPRFKMKLVEFTFPKIFGEEQSHLYVNIVGDGLCQLFDEYSTLDKSEIVRYLAEGLDGSSSELDVLEWWSENNGKYPTLSRMARDILSIPVSTVGSQFVYSTTAMPRELSLRMSSVKPETLEALVCTKDWFQYGLTEVNTEV
ncbi:Zinc finger BED domain-containing protein DAYSLEEPER [Linum grandiflorum]